MITFLESNWNWNDLLLICNDSLVFLSVPVKINGTKEKITSFWLMGFVEAEGSFCVDIINRKDIQLGKQIQLSFMITQHSEDENLLNLINDQFFEAKGFVENSRDSKSPVKRLGIRDLNTILTLIIPFFDSQTFFSRKERDSKDWKSIAFLMKNKEHLTPTGLAEILTIEERMNRGRTHQGLINKLKNRRKEF